MLRACVLSLVLISATSATSATATLAAAQTPSTPAAPAAVPFDKPTAPGELVDIGGRRLHLECKGDTKGPTVLIEAGLSQYTAHSTYGKAQELIAPFARVCTYDRAGLGWSDPATGARTPQAMIEDLHALVMARKLQGPMVLVGHSVGGLLTRLYAKTYPADVAGMVLADATPEAYLYGPGAADARKALVAKIDEGLKNAKPGVPVVPIPAGTDANIVIAWLPEVLHTVKQEYEAIDQVPESLRHQNGFGTLGDMPLVVIRRGKTATPPTDDDQQWKAMQEALSKLSTHGELVVAEGAGHVIPYEAPQVVADAVQRILKVIPPR